MFFRFAVVVLAVIGIALAGIALERSALALRRSITLQEFRRGLLLEERARLRVRIETLSAPERLQTVAPAAATVRRP